MLIEIHTKIKIKLTLLCWPTISALICANIRCKTFANEWAGRKESARTGLAVELYTHIYSMKSTDRAMWAHVFCVRHLSRCQKRPATRNRKQGVKSHWICACFFQVDFCGPRPIAYSATATPRVKCFTYTSDRKESSSSISFFFESTFNVIVYSRKRGKRRRNVLNSWFIGYRQKWI